MPNMIGGFELKTPKQVGIRSEHIYYIINKNLVSNYENDIDDIEEEQVLLPRKRTIGY